MISAARLRLRFGLLVCVLFLARPARATITYTVSLAQPENHVLAVSMHISDVRDHVILQMPAWNALYQIRDFSSHVMQVTARNDAGKVLGIQKLDKQTWQVTGTGGVIVSYTSYWDEPGPFASQLNPDHAFLNFAMFLMYVPDRRDETAELSFADVPAKWRVAVELDHVAKGASEADGAYTAPSYDALVDAPAEVGAFQEFDFEAAGKPIRVLVHGDAGDSAHLKDGLSRIVNSESTLMGGAPFREYLFLLHAGRSFGGGGMEHMNSTAIASDDAGQIFSYAAHEFFHAWNVKRIRPQALEPVDYTKEMYTRSLWFAEGVTDTYGGYTMERTGLWSTRQFYDNLASQIGAVETRPAHLWQSAEQSSLDTWLEKYPSYNRPDTSVSYYDKGQLLGVLLDILIRDSTNNQASLDDFMRLLNEKFARQGRYYNDQDDLRKTVEEVIQSKASAASTSVRQFFDRYVSGTEELPLTDYLGRAGWELKESRVTSSGQTTITYQIVEVHDPTDKQRGIRDGILHGTVNAAR
jgi:predicted metalloprotease with PDZ domain